MRKSAPRITGTATLVPLDGSVLAEQGLHAACRLAGTMGAELLLLSAVPFSAGADPAERETARAALHAAHEHLSAQWQAAGAVGISARTLVLPGDPAQAILFAAEEHHVDLISMATHGRTGLRQGLLGSVAAAVVRGTRTPTLLSRATQLETRTALPYRRILVPLDGTPFAERALAYLQDQGLAEGTELLLLRAVTPAQPYMGAPIMAPNEAEAIARQVEDMTDQRRREADAYLHTVAAEHLGGRSSRLIVLVEGPAAAIADAVATTHADLVVLATQDRRGLDRLLHGSVAHDVLQQVMAPVLLLHGAPDAGEQEVTIEEAAAGEVGEPEAASASV